MFILLFPIQTLLILLSLIVFTFCLTIRYRSLRDEWTMDNPQNTLDLLERYRLRDKIYRTTNLRC